MTHLKRQRAEALSPPWLTPERNPKMTSMRIRRVAYGLLTIVIGLSLVWAGDLTITAGVDRTTLALDEQLQLTITISGDTGSLPQLSLPELPNFSVYSSGRSQNMSFINGQMTSSVALNFILAPKQTGKHVIPAFTLQFGGKAYTTQAIAVEVKPGGANKPASSPRGAQPGERAGEGVFVKGEVDRTQAYVNEQITYTFKFYRRIQLLRNPEYAPPSFTGFLTEDLPPQHTDRVTLEGIPYEVTEIKTALFPTAPGAPILPEARLSVSVNDVSSGNDFFQNFFARGKTQVLTTAPIKLKILPLPTEGKPAEFEGAVGRYAISAVFEQPSGKMYDPMTLKVTLSGSGHIKSLPPFKLPPLDGFKAYEPVTSLNLSKDRGIVKGSQVYTIILVPQRAGTLKIPPMPFAYFDPADHRYHRVTTAPLTTKIAEAAASATPPMIALSSPGVTVVGQDIRHIKPADRLGPVQPPYFRRKGFLAFQASPFFLVLAVWQYQLWQTRQQRDGVGFRKKRATRRALTRLKELGLAAGHEATPPHIHELASLLLNFLAEKSGVPSASLTLKHIDLLLQKGRVDDLLRQEAMRALERLDVLRFAPTTLEPGEFPSLLASIERLIEGLDRVSL